MAYGMTDKRFWKTQVLPNLSTMSKEAIQLLLNDFIKHNTTTPNIVKGKEYIGAFGYEINFLQNYLEGI